MENWRGKGGSVAYVWPNDGILTRDWEPDDRKLAGRNKVATVARNTAGAPRWGLPPWTIKFRAEERELPEEVDFAVVGGGFTGLAAAAWLRRLEPKKSVAVFETSRIGAGSSGHTGGMTLGETAAGDLPGLGDVLGGFSGILRELHVECDLSLPGALEIGREKILANSPIEWTDSGNLGVKREVPGGTIDPGKMASGLAKASRQRGALIFESARVENLQHGEPAILEVRGKQVRARGVLLATNAASLELSGLAKRAQAKFTLAVATEALSEEQFGQVGLAEGKPFYTVDLPYLWGRVVWRNRVIFGSGLVHLEDWRELLTLDVASGQTAELMGQLEKRVHGLHPALRDVRLSHRWGGPILIADKWQPVFARHAENRNVIMLGGYSGHGVALSVYLGAWAAEAMLGRRELPQWDAEA
jgi:glycine/D-amino acid oxidase-like deaminating enzyme